MILKVNIITAKIPSGCRVTDSSIRPWNNKDMEAPKPHPGQKSKPIFLIGQIEKCVASGVIKVRTKSPPDQMIASQGKYFDAK